MTLYKKIIFIILFLTFSILFGTLLIYLNKQEQIKIVQNKNIFTDLQKENIIDPISKKEGNSLLEIQKVEEVKKKQSGLKSSLSSLSVFENKNFLLYYPKAFVQNKDKEPLVSFTSSEYLIQKEKTLEISLEVLQEDVISKNRCDEIINLKFINTTLKSKILDSTFFNKSNETGCEYIIINNLNQTTNIKIVYNAKNKMSIVIYVKYNKDGDKQAIVDLLKAYKLSGHIATVK